MDVVEVLTDAELELVLDGIPLAGRTDLDGVVGALAELQERAEAEPVPPLGVELRIALADAEVRARCTRVAPVGTTAGRRPERSVRRTSLVGAAGIALALGFGATQNALPSGLQGIAASAARQIGIALPGPAPGVVAPAEDPPGAAQVEALRRRQPGSPPVAPSGGPPDPTPPAGAPDPQGGPTAAADAPGHVGDHSPAVGPGVARELGAQPAPTPSGGDPVPQAPAAEPAPRPQPQPQPQPPLQPPPQPTTQPAPTDDPGPLDVDDQTDDEPSHPSDRRPERAPAPGTTAPGPSGPGGQVGSGEQPQPAPGPETARRPG